MPSGRDDFYGVSVSGEEVLQKLGHPSGWYELERRLEFQNRLRDGESELDITGIRGSPGFPGYLEYLDQSFKKPLGYDTNLISDEERDAIRDDVRSDISFEIVKYRRILFELLQSTHAIKRYIDSLKRSIPILKMGIDPNLEAQPIEELVELAKLGNEKARKNIEDTERLIKECEEKLSWLEK